MKELQDNDLESFLGWAAELGISDLPSEDTIPFSSSSSSSSLCMGHSLSISYFPSAGGRGLAAARDLRKGELILRVPKTALMTRDSLLEKDTKLSIAANRHPYLSSTQMLAVCLLAEMCKGRKSLWYPYLMQLPRSYDILASFGQFESKAFQVDDAIWVTERAISKAESDWKDVIAVIEDLRLRPQFATFKAWLWACATVRNWTRICMGNLNAYMRVSLVYAYRRCINVILFALGMPKCFSSSSLIICRMIMYDCRNL